MRRAVSSTRKGTTRERMNVPKSEPFERYTERYEDCFGTHEAAYQSKVDGLDAAGFSELEFVQTIYHRPDEIDEPEPIEEGYGDGSFVGIKAS